MYAGSDVVGEQRLPRRRRHLIATGRISTSSHFPQAMEQINTIQTRQRFNTSMPETGIPGFADFSRI
jgi:hypothetical protein